MMDLTEDIKLYDPEKAVLTLTHYRSMLHDSSNYLYCKGMTADAVLLRLKNTDLHKVYLKEFEKIVFPNDTDVVGMAAKVYVIHEILQNTPGVCIDTKYAPVLLLAMLKMMLLLKEKRPDILIKDVDLSCPTIDLFKYIGYDASDGSDDGYTHLIPNAKGERK